MASLKALLTAAGSRFIATHAKEVEERRHRDTEFMRSLVPVFPGPTADEQAIAAHHATSLLVELSDWIVAHPDCVTFATDYGDTPTEVNVRLPEHLVPAWEDPILATWADIIANMGFTYHDEGFLQWTVK